MSEILKGDSTLHTKCCPATPGPEKTGWENLGLPVSEYVVVMPAAILGLSLVVHRCGSLCTSSEIPTEVFLDKDITERDRSIMATSQNLKAAGLAEIFAPDEAANLSYIGLKYGQAVQGALICKLQPNESLDHVRTLCNRWADDLRRFLEQRQNLVDCYQAQITGMLFPLCSPALVSDARRRILAANAMFVELVGRHQSQITGLRLQDMFHLEEEPGDDIPDYPGILEFATPMFFKTRSSFFVSDLHISRIKTICGQRLLYVFHDLLTDQRTGNSNIQLVQKLSHMIMSSESPQTIIRRLINTLVSTLDCDLVCIMRRKDNDEMIATPHLNRDLKTLRVNFIELALEPALEPFFMRGVPVFCEDVERCCPPQSFFRQVLRTWRFAFLPIGYAPRPEYALLMAWSKSSTRIGRKALPLLRLAGNLIGAVLIRSRLVAEMEQEKDILRRHTRLTVGREVRMAQLKKENAVLRQTLMRLTMPEKE